MKLTSGRPCREETHVPDFVGGARPANLRTAFKSDSPPLRAPLSDACTRWSSRNWCACRCERESSGFSFWSLAGAGEGELLVFGRWSWAGGASAVVRGAVAGGLERGAGLAATAGFAGN